MSNMIETIHSKSETKASSKTKIAYITVLEISRADYSEILQNNDRVIM